jgi:hypothetical protein
MRQNFYKLLKTHIEKMSTFCLSTIFMKTSHLYDAFHDVDENKGESRLCGLTILGWRGRPDRTHCPALARVMPSGEAAHWMGWK